MILSWLRRGLHTGVLTTRYPATHEEMPRGFRGRPALDAERCLAGQGCDRCVQACLPAALSLATVTNNGRDKSGSSTINREATNREPTVPQLTLDYGRCIMCGLCVAACPADALRMVGDYELASTTSDDLRVSAVFTQEDDANGRDDEEKNNDRYA